MNKEFEQQIADKINALILPENLDHARILLQENAGSLDSIIIRLENNPWRNGVIKGDIILARIKTSGDTQYLNFKNKFLYLFDGMDIKSLPVPDAEAQYDWARVELNSFMELLNAPTEDLIKAINTIYLGSIVFPEFGCCSKFKECSEKRECVHIDRLYSTACQYRKIISKKNKMKIPNGYKTFENFEDKLSKYKEWDFRNRNRDELRTLYYKGIYIDGYSEECDIVGYYDDDIRLLIELKSTRERIVIDRNYLKQMQDKDFRRNQSENEEKNNTSIEKINISETEQLSFSSIEINPMSSNNHYDTSNERVNKGESIIDFPKDYVVIDLETTGLMPDFDEIIEIAALKVQDGKVTDKFQQLVKPDNEIGSFIEKLTGITNEMLESAPKINEVLPLFDKFVDDSTVVGHNVNFDVNFLYDNYMNVLEKPFSNNFIDTMRISRKIYPELSHHRLKDIVQHLSIKENGYHRALQDCEYTYKCYQSMENTVIQDFNGIQAFQALFRKNGKLDLTKIVTDKTDFDETNPLYKKVCVFTGTLEKYTRQQAAQIVVNLGGICGNTVSKKTDYLILGNNDYCSTIKNGKSSKQKKAEEYKLKGQDIEIIPESVFYDMISEN